jgi:Patatin phospholipase
MARRDEIVYAERVHNDLRIRELSDAYREMVTLILSQVDADTRRRLGQFPLFIQLMSDEAATHITRFQRPRAPGEPSSRDCDFSYDAITRHQVEGYDLVKRTLEHARRPRLPVQPTAAPSAPTERHQARDLRKISPRKTAGFIE